MKTFTKYAEERDSGSPNIFGSTDGLGKALKIASERFPKETKEFLSGLEDQDIKDMLKNDEDGPDPAKDLFVRGGKRDYDDVVPSKADSGVGPYDES